MALRKENKLRSPFDQRIYVTRGEIFAPPDHDISCAVDDALGSIVGKTDTSLFAQTSKRNASSSHMGRYSSTRRIPKVHNLPFRWAEGKLLSRIPAVDSLLSGPSKTLSPQRMMGTMQRNIQRLRRKFQSYRSQTLPPRGTGLITGTAGVRRGGRPLSDAERKI